jgi:L-alanine-DL-glutamate epimerase-like enolase superfamily enzyme
MARSEHKIVSWALNCVQIPYQRKVVWSDTTASHAPLLILKLEADDGAIGVAEVTVQPTWYGVNFNTLIASLEELMLPILSRTTLTRPEDFLKSSAQIPENSIARTLIDNALWDVDLARHEEADLDGMAAGSADVSWLITRQPPADMASEARNMVETYGFKALKIKGGQGTETDLQAVAAIRRAVGDSVRLYVDTNWHYSPAEAVDYVNRLAQHGIVAVEDPYALAPNREFEAIQARCDIPILVDYFAHSLADAHLFAERGMKALSLKPARMGLSVCAAQKQFADGAGVDVHVGFGGESDLGALASLRFACALNGGGWLPAEVTFFLMLSESLLLQPLRIHNGTIRFPAAAPVSALVDFDKLERLSFLRKAGRF